MGVLSWLGIGKNSSNNNDPQRMESLKNELKVKLKELKNLENQLGPLVKNRRNLLRDVEKFERDLTPKVEEYKSYLDHMFYYDMELVAFFEVKPGKNISSELQKEREKMKNLKKEKEKFLRSVSPGLINSFDLLKKKTRELSRITEMMHTLQDNISGKMIEISRIERKLSRFV